jgi:hypothetical protein
VRRTLAVLTTVVLLLVGADRAAAYATSRTVAQRIQESVGLPTTPSVAVGGFPFVTQVLQGRLGRVDVDLRDLPAGSGAPMLLLDGVRVTLFGVRAPVGKTLSGNLSSIRVERGVLAAHAGFDTLGTALSRAIGDGATVTLGSPEPGILAVQGTLNGPEGGIPFMAQGTVQLDGGALRVVPVKVTDVPAGLGDVTFRTLGVRLPLPELPLGLRPTAVSVGPEGVLVRATADDVEIVLR